jgi:dTDP-4-amino-4,6-dideoxygalactose transaminase
VGPEDRHVYYFYPMRFDEAVWGLSRDTFVQAVRAEGIEMRQGYVRPIYWEPLYQRRVAFAGGHFPFDLVDPMPEYPRGLCPVVEEAHERSLVFGKFCRWPLTRDHARQVVEAVRKVWDHRSALTEPS